MVNLTQPAMLCFGKVPDDPVFRNHFLTVTAHLQTYKEVVPTLTVVATFIFLWTLLQNKCIWCVFVFVSQAFASERVFGVLSETLYNFLQLVSIAVLQYSQWLPSICLSTFILLSCVWSHAPLSGLGAEAGGGQSADRENSAAGPECSSCSCWSQWGEGQHTETIMYVIVSVYPIIPSIIVSVVVRAHCRK